MRSPTRRDGDKVGTHHASWTRTSRTTSPPRPAPASSTAAPARSSSSARRSADNDDRGRRRRSLHHGGKVTVTRQHHHGQHRRRWRRPLQRGSVELDRAAAVFDFSASTVSGNTAYASGGGMSNGGESMLTITDVDILRATSRGTPARSHHRRPGSARTSPTSPSPATSQRRGRRCLDRQRTAW